MIIYENHWFSKENQRFDKYSTFTKKGNAGYHHLSEISDEFLTYIKHRFLSFWPTLCPFGVSSFHQNNNSYEYFTDNSLVSNKELWNNISSFGKPFSLEELHSNIDNKLSLEDLRAWLDNCVELDHLQILNGQYILYFRVPGRPCSKRTWKCLWPDLTTGPLVP